MVEGNTEIKNEYGFDSTIAVIGAGYIGSVLSAVMADSGANVVALDINNSIVDAINSGRSPVREPGLDDLIHKAVASGKLRASGDFSGIQNAQVVLITVGTPLGEEFNPDTSGIDSVVDAISPYVRSGQLIVVKSTVPPYTTEINVAAPLRKHANVLVAFCPERLAEGNAIEECRKIPVVVGGVDQESTEAATRFWDTMLGVEVRNVGSARAAELVKLANNAWIDLNIALAFELAKLADKMEVDVLPIISAANSLPKGEYNVNILTPSVGVGGYCLTKDPWFLDSFARGLNTDFKTAVASRTVNDQAPLYSANRLQKELSDAFPDTNNSEIKVAVLGLSFKNNTGDCRFTPTLPFIDQMASLGYDLFAYDPWISDEDWSIFNKVKRCNNLYDVLAGSHAVAYLAGHGEFYNLTAEVLKEKLQNNAVLFDGRMFFPRDDIESFENQSFNYIGVGR